MATVGASVFQQNSHNKNQSKHLSFDAPARVGGRCFLLQVCMGHKGREISISTPAKDTARES